MMDSIKQGLVLVHATPACNLREPPNHDHQFLPHEFGEMKGGMLESSLHPLCTTDHGSKRPMVKVWVLPGGRIAVSAWHCMVKHSKAVEASNGKIALIFFTPTHPQFNEFVRFGAGGHFVAKCL